MTSKEIIIRLIDNKTINGEEAYLLINDILKAEMVAVNEALGKIKTPETINIPSTWSTASSLTYDGSGYIATK